MKKITLLIFAAFFLAVILISTPQGFVHAQTACGVPDAAGAVIPCPEPPSGDQGNGDNEDNNGGGNKDQPSVPATATATSTPLPLATSTNDGAREKPDDWSHVCKKGEGQVNCMLAAAETCQSDGGDATGTTNKNGSVTITCSFIVIEPTPLPLTGPTDDGAREKPDDWSHVCKKGEGQVNCILAAGETCQSDGGDATGTTNKNGSVTVTCSFLIIEPTPLPIAAPSNVDPINPGVGFPDWLPWLGGGILGILFALSVQGVRKYMANAKTAETAIESNRHKLMETLLNKDDDGNTEAGAGEGPWELGDIKGESADDSNDAAAPVRRPRPLTGSTGGGGGSGGSGH